MARNTKRISPTKGEKIPIALSSPITVENDLPFRYIYYPESYGIFFGFSEYVDSDVYLCSCNVDLVLNYEKIRLSSDFYTYSNALDNAKYSNKQFPKIIATMSLDDKYKIQFKDKLCHRCNLKTPSLRYCHEMYGGKFKQHYGWYINQINLRFSYLKYYSNNYKYFPEELIPLLNEISKLQNQQVDFNSPIFNREKFLIQAESDKEISKLQRKVDNFFENIAREEFGFRKIGEGNVSELLMANLIQQIYPNEELIMHHRPKWLLGLELDVYLPNIRTGFEYQGQQHFHSIKAWGGEPALIKNQERDKKKRLICSDNQIKLIEIDYTEPLSIEYIRSKISKHCR